jgi:hypothetical protein
MISSGQIEVLDNEILKILRNFKPSYGLQAPAICAFLVPSGFSMTPDEVIYRIEYLADKGMAMETNKVLHRPMPNGEQFKFDGRPR